LPISTGWRRFRAFGRLLMERSMLRESASCQGQL
jgi:hypothetical protein